MIIDRTESIVESRSGDILANGKIFIGVVVYRNSEMQLRRLIESLKISLNESGIAGRIALWSTDSFRRDSQFADVDIHTSKNIGFGAAHNNLMKEAFRAGFDYYLCINPDGYLHHAAITRLIASAKYADNNALIEAVQVPVQHPKPFDPLLFDTPWISGACFLMPKNIYDVIGGFDENFFMYCEDVDLSWRAKFSGFLLKCEPRAMFYHDISSRHRNIPLERQLMLSARYLGKKWQCQDFCDWVENAMVANGLIRDKRSLPSLTVQQTFPMDSDIVEFRADFSFSFARW